MTCLPRHLALLAAVVLALPGCAGEEAEPAVNAQAATAQADARDPALAQALAAADTAMAEGRLAEAGRLLDEARAMTPDDPDLWVAIARLRFRGGEHLTALEAADRALELGPDHAPALLMRALMVRDAHGFADALPWFEAALAADRRDADAWAEYAATLGDLGRHRAMLGAVRELAEVAPRDARLFYLQAVLAQRGGNPVLARTLLDRSGMAARGVPAGLLLDALISLEQGNHDSAVERLTLLAERQPANAQARDLLAYALLLAGREAELVARFAGDAAQPEASAYLAMVLARAHERLGDRASAAPLLERAYRLPDAAPVALAARAGLPGPTAELRALAATGNWGAARRAAQGWRARFPASADLAQLAGDAMLGAGDSAAAGKAALAAYAPAARVRRPWRLSEKAAIAYRSAGDPVAAETLLARHVAGEPQNIAALVALAGVAAQRGGWTQAALLLDHAMALGGGHDPALLEMRARAARALGESEAADRFAALAATLRPAALTAP